mgnify:CR=1 FL=1
MEVALKNKYFKFPGFIWKEFIRTWQFNRAQILRITLVNLMVTLVSELVVRKFMVHFGLMPATESLFYLGKLHTQVVINLIMTVPASLFGSVVYFFSSLRSRYLFFICFALVPFISAPFLKHRSFIKFRRTN